MKRIDPFGPIEKVRPKQRDLEPRIDITKLASCNEMMDLSLTDIFENWFITLDDKAWSFYKRTYIPKLEGIGGIFNLKYGAPLFTVKEFNERDHHDAEFIINDIMGDKARPYLLCYQNLCLYLHKITRGLFRAHRSRF